MKRGENRSRQTENTTSTRDWKRLRYVITFISFTWVFTEMKSIIKTKKKSLRDEIKNEIGKEVQNAFFLNQDIIKGLKTEQNIILFFHQV